MVPDDVMKLVADIVATSDEQHREQVIEAWIAETVADMNHYAGIMGTHHVSDPAIKDEIDLWIARQRKRFAFQVGQVMQLLLRQELLGKQK